MALNYNDWHDLMLRIRQLRRDNRYYEIDSPVWKKRKKELEDAIALKKSHRVIPSEGDLITDEEYPSDGIAVIVGVGDRRKKKRAYKVLCPSGEVVEFDRDYIEYQCRTLNSGATNAN